LGVFIVVAFYCPLVLVVVVAESSDEGDNSLDEGVGSEEVADARVGEEGALTLKAEDHIVLCGGDGWGMAGFFRI
jgi:hypothetical protein